MQLKQYIIVVVLLLMASCGGPSIDDRPPSYFQPSSIWMNRLNLVMQHDNSSNTKVMKYRNKTITIKPLMSQVTIGNKTYKLRVPPRVWNGDVFLHNASIDLIKAKLGPAPQIRTVRKSRPEWEPNKAAANRHWKYIVVHHTAGENDTIESIDRSHKAIDYDCIGYHFLIGNGVNTINGNIEPTIRWKYQKHGAHARATVGTIAYNDNRYNNHGIGVCLVGNYMNGNQPSKKQMDALVQLVKYLQSKYKISKENVIPHKHVKNTACPGNSFPWESFKSKIKN